MSEWMINIADFQHLFYIITVHISPASVLKLSRQFYNFHPSYMLECNVYDDNASTDLIVSLETNQP